MTNKLRNRFAAAALTGAATIALACGGAAAAHADVAPPVTPSDTQSFRVLPPGAFRPDQAHMLGSIYMGFSSSSLSDISLSLSCDDGLPEPLVIKRDGAEMLYKADLPLRLIGHTCTLSATAPSGYRVTFWGLSGNNDEGIGSTGLSGQLIPITVVPPGRGKQY
jgi:hypothetical protein